ncbi:hypothetical protein DAPPUDRAFT_264197 [Daphnia pulex]|uniref:Uncharacterized protein n=1 Tax=Daphnia pulex TaxID=6669 RepID=E9HR27_DAPPU|nr:hypothetical protein DAPPUDRAFT_264197 [Daphnia pulex]|eukprot:EFX65808.1 hypothetical protein DAPPUDRAFT_264197 [Daphnia pulex]
MDHEPIFKSKNGNLFKKEDVVDYYYESEVPDQPFQPSAKQDQLIAEKVESSNPPMESKLENLKFCYNNLKSQNAKDACELEELSTRIQYLLQHEMDLDQTFSLLKQVKE